MASPAVRAAPQVVVLPRAFSTAEVADAQVVTPPTVDTLEWELDSPPTLHQFEEPPIVVEIAHLV